MRPVLAGSRLFAAVTVLLTAVSAQSSAHAQAVSPQGAESDLAAGKRAFDVNCARCHGIGGGGDTGPSLTQPSLPRARNDTLLRSIIADGIPGTEMPNSFWLSDADVRHIMVYVRSLGAVAAVASTGGGTSSAAKGRAVYERMECASCHIVNGVGGAIGPELTSIGSRRSPAYLRRAILDPGADFPRERNVQLFAVVDVVPRSGPKVTGVRVNEDTYTIQLRDADGVFYSYRKSELVSLERRFAASLMPSLRGKLTDAELDDLVAYLVTLRTAP